MDNIVEIKDLSFSYGDVEVFSNLNLNIKRGSFTTIIGPNSSGKSTLVKLIIGLEEGNNFVHTCFLPVVKENLINVRKQVGVVYENPDKMFVAETVMDEIAFSLENLRYDKQNIRKRVERIVSLFGISDILEKSPMSLDVSSKSLVAFACCLVMEPKLLLIDGGLTNLDDLARKKVVKILKDLNENDGMTIINITNMPDDMLYGDRIILLDKGKVILNDDLFASLEKEDLFEKARVELPFVVTLSNKLKFYNLVDKVYFDSKKLVDDLWK